MKNDKTILNYFKPKHKTDNRIYDIYNFFGNDIKGYQLIIIVYNTIIDPNIQLYKYSREYDLSIEKFKKSNIYHEIKLMIL